MNNKSKILNPYRHRDNTLWKLDEEAQRDTRDPMSTLKGNSKQIGQIEKPGKYSKISHHHA